MFGAPMTYDQRRAQADAAGMPAHEFVRGRKSAGTLVERRPHCEPGRSARRRAQFQTVAAEQPLPIGNHAQPNATAYIAPCGRVRIGPEDIS